MSFGWRWKDIDEMLVTDVWDALEGLSLEPPTHILVYAIATALGYKPASPPVPSETKGTKVVGNVSGEVGAMMAIAGRPKPASAVPQHIQESPTLKRLFAEMGAA